MLLTLWLTDIERRFIQAQLSKYALIPRQAIISGFSLGSLKQWGRVQNNAASKKVYYPIAFSSACYALVFGIVYNNSQYSYDQVTSYDKTGFYTYQNIDDPLTIRYVVIGQ